MKPPLSLDNQVLCGIKIGKSWYFPLATPPSLMRIVFFASNKVRLVFHRYTVVFPISMVEAGSYGEPTLLASGTITEE